MPVAGASLSLDPPARYPRVGHQGEALAGYLGESFEPDLDGEISSRNQHPSLVWRMAVSRMAGWLSDGMTQVDALLRAEALSAWHLDRCEVAGQHQLVACCQGQRAG